jgi:hypothetical protein
MGDATRVTEVYVLFAEEPGGEGLVATTVGDVVAPLLSIDQAGLPALQAMAQQAADESGRTVKLARLTAREDIATFTKQPH